MLHRSLVGPTSSGISRGSPPIHPDGCFGQRSAHESSRCCFQRRSVIALAGGRSRMKPLSICSQSTRREKSLRRPTCPMTGTGTVRGHSSFLVGEEDNGGLELGKH
jgi:hypothetical protein